LRIEIGLGLQLGDDVSRKGSREVPPANNTRLTEEERVLMDVDEGFLLRESWVDDKCDDCKWGVSVNGSPLKIVIGSGEEGWGRGSTI